MRKIFTSMLALASLLAMHAAGSANDFAQKRTPAHVAMEASTRADNLSDLPLVTETPAGDLTSYSKEAVYFGRGFYGQLFTSADFGRIAEVVRSSDGKIWFKNPLCGVETGSWLEGTVDGDKIMVSFPQKIYSETFVDYEADPEGNVTTTNNFYAFKLNYTNDGEKSKMELDLSDPTIYFSLTDNGIKMEGDAFIGMLMEQTAPDENGVEQTSVIWTGYADSKINMTVVNDVPVALPDGMQTEEWVLAADGNVRFVNVGIDGQDIYIQGMLSSMPDGVFKGTMEEGKVVFKGPQYMGEDLRSSHFAYFIPSVVTMNEDPEAFEPYIFNYADSISFDYDDEQKAIYSYDDLGMAFSTIPNAVFLIEGYYAPEFRWQDSSTPMTPDNPEILNYEYFDDYGYGALAYTVPYWSTDGRVLDSSKLYYNFFIDDDILVLYPDEYTDLEEPMEDIPADYEDSYIYIFGGEHEAVIFPTGFERIGVRTFYVNADGSRTYSDIVYNDGTIVSGINPTEIALKEIISTEFFSIDGRRVENPADGNIVIRRTVYSDGSVKTAKVIRR